MNCQNTKHILYLDGWRGMAIICVLAAHLFGFEKIAGLGVDIFFVLSGILMSRILFIDQIPLRDFYRRRVARVLPLFWLYTSVVFLVWSFYFGQFDIAEFISTLFFVRTYFPATPIVLSAFPIGHVWSLNVEEHSYILLSIISLIALRSRLNVVRWSLTACSIACVGFFAYYKFVTPDAHMSWFLRIEVAAFPLLAASAFFMWLKKYPISVPPAVPLLTLGGAFLIAMFSHSFAFRFYGISTLLAVSINTLHVAPNWSLKILSNPALRWFGVCSFSIYMWQQPFFFLSRYANGWKYYSIFSLFCTLAIACVSFYYFENPVRKLLTNKSRVNTLVGRGKVDSVGIGHA